jgi:hypothetical protein
LNIKKIIRSNRKTNPFGGICFVMNAVEKKNLASLIDNKLGKRAKQAKFPLSNIILNWIYSNFCGADRLEDAKNLKRKCFQTIPGFNYASPDSIALIFKSLSTTSTKILNKSKIKGELSSITHEFNFNPKLNELMLDIAMKLDLLKKNVPHTLDYDCTIIETEKFDSTYTYKENLKGHIKGYQPGVSFIGKLPIYIENRQGRTHAAYKMEEVLERSLENLDRHGIKPKSFRSDAAAYQKGVVDLMDSKGIEFFIRAKNTNFLKDEAEFSLEWEEKKFRHETKSVCDIRDFQPDGWKKPYRIVLERKLTDGQYFYYGIMTNNMTMSMEEVVHFYNQRGDAENNFKALKKDFNWNHLPFSYLNQNTVFLIISAIADIIYQYIIGKYSSQVDFVKKSFRLKKFIQYVIALSAILYEDGSMEIESDEYDYEALRDL